MYTILYFASYTDPPSLTLLQSVCCCWLPTNSIKALKAVALKAVRKKRNSFVTAVCSFSNWRFSVVQEFYVSEKQCTILCECKSFPPSFFFRTDSTDSLDWLLLMSISFFLLFSFSVVHFLVVLVPSVLWRCWVGRQKGHPARKKLGSDDMLVWLSNVCMWVCM